MLKATKKLLEHNAFLIASFFSVLIVYFSLASLEDLNIEISNSDKFLHTFGYFILSLSWFFAFRDSLSRKKVKILILFFVFTFGCFIEILQGVLTANRVADLFDIFANTLGIVLAFTLFNPLLKVYHRF